MSKAVPLSAKNSFCEALDLRHYARGLIACQRAARARGGTVRNSGGEVRVGDKCEGRWDDDYSTCRRSLLQVALSSS